MTAQALKEFRNSLNLTQTEFAERIGITSRKKQTIMEWEKGKVKVPKPYKILLSLLVKGRITFEDFL